MPAQKYGILIGCCLLLLLFCSAGVQAASEAAPEGLSYPVVDTGQGKSYGLRHEMQAPAPGKAFYGQDAHYNGTQPQYLDNGDGTVSDLVTGLIWQKTPPKKQMTHAQALRYANNLTLAGKSDWRMPTIKELYSLMNFRGCIRTKTPYIDTTIFDFSYPDTTKNRIVDAQYWSSNVYLGTVMRGDTAAFGVNFADGRIKCYPIALGGRRRGASKFVRCVRGRTDYGKNDFVENGDGTITDRATGLMWTQKTSEKPMYWGYALAYAENLALAGHDDWRLPNAKELQSLVDYDRAPDAREASKRGPAIDPLFKLASDDCWAWASTTHLDNMGGVYVCFGKASAYNHATKDFSIDAHGAGAQRSDPKLGTPDRYPRGHGPQSDQVRIYNYVLCVRDAVPQTKPVAQPAGPVDRSSSVK